MNKNYSFFQRFLNNSENNAMLFFIKNIIILHFVLVLTLFSSFRKFMTFHMSKCHDRVSVCVAWSAWFQDVVSLCNWAGSWVWVKQNTLYKRIPPTTWGRMPWLEWKHSSWKFYRWRWALTDCCCCCCCCCWMLLLLKEYCCWAPRTYVTHSRASPVKILT